MSTSSPEQLSKQMQQKPLRRSPLKRKTVKSSRTSHTASWFRKQSDILFSRQIRLVGHCEKCGSVENLNCSHIISRTVMHLRCDPRNAICLCYRCHIYWWHIEPLEAARWFESKWPGRYDELLKERQNVRKVDWKQVYEELKSK